MKSYKIRIFNRFNILIFSLLIANILILTGCKNSNEGNGGKAVSLDDKVVVELEEVPVLNFKLNEIFTTDFSMKIPEGWVYELNPSNLAFGLIAHDPEKPERRLYYYYYFNPFMKSVEARNLFLNAYGSTNIFATCPVLQTGQLQEFYSKWNEYMDFLDYHGIQAATMRFKDMEFLETHPLQNYLSDYSIDSAILRALITLDGSNLPCDSLLSGSLVSTGSYFENGVDVFPMMVYNVMGIMAPADEFPQIQSSLIESLSSFSFTESYVKEYKKRNEDATKVILENARTMQAAYDSYNESVYNAQDVIDTKMQMVSDSTLGYDRLYDEDNDEVIRAELGWYDDKYEPSRNSYNRPNIRKIEDNEYELYDRVVDYTIN